MPTSLAFFTSLIMLYYGYLNLDRLWMQFKYFKTNEKILYTISKPKKEINAHFIKMEFLVGVMTLIVGLGLGIVSLYDVLPRQTLLMTLIIWVAFDGYIKYSAYQYGVYMTETGVYSGCLVYPWHQIVHHRWLIKEQKKETSDRTFIVFRKMGQFMPLTIQTEAQQSEAIQDVLDRFIENKERKEKS